MLLPSAPTNDATPSTTPAAAQRLGLRGRIVFVVVAIVLLVVLFMSTYFTVLSAQQVDSDTRETVTVMRDAMRQQGVLLAENVALSSERALAYKDYLFLKDIIDNVTRHDKNIAYGIIMSQERKALIDTDTSKAGTVLGAPHDLLAAAADASTAIEVQLDGKNFLEVVAPIHLSGKVWGKVRFGISLDPLNQQIEHSAELAHTRIVTSIVTSVLGALVLFAIGSWLGLLFSKRLTGPLDSLLEGVLFIQRGDLDKRVEVMHDIPEFETLGTAFNEMAENIKRRQSDLEIALQRMEEAYRLKSEFLANVSHELRTPLNAIINVPNILLRDYSSTRIFACQSCGEQYAIENDGDPNEVMPESVECPNCHGQAIPGSAVVFNGRPADHLKYLEIALSSARHLLKVVDDLLDFSKMEAGRMRLALSKFTLGPALLEIVQTVDILAQDKGVKLTFERLTGNEEVQADNVKLSQMVLNLISNAIKFTPRGGTVALSVAGLDDASPNSRLKIMVRDTGEGIPADKLGIIFDSFRQVDGGHTRKHGGTGLGLTITKQLAKMHGGDVVVESTLGQGSVFTIEIPRYARQTEEENPSQEGVGQGRKIVVVDDDPVQLTLVSRVLSEAGFKTVTVKSSAEALDVITQVKPDLAIFDMLMPDISGLTLLRNLRADPENGNLPVIISTAFANHRDIVSRFGGLWLRKPWEMHDLLAAVHAGLDLGKDKGKDASTESSDAGAASNGEEPVGKGG